MGPVSSLVVCVLAKAPKHSEKSSMEGVHTRTHTQLMAPVVQVGLRRD